MTFYFVNATKNDECNDECNDNTEKDHDSNYSAFYEELSERKLAIELDEYDCGQDIEDDRSEEYLENKIKNIPKEIVNYFIDWAIENLDRFFDDNSEEFMKDFGISDYDKCFKYMKSQINYKNVKTALISFMMYSLKNPDEYLDDFKITGWDGFELYGSGSGRQLLSIIHGCDF